MGERGSRHGGVLSVQALQLTDSLIDYVVLSATVLAASRYPGH